jgi:hypothetical protein
MNYKICFYVTDVIIVDAFTWCFLCYTSLIFLHTINLKSLPSSARIMDVSFLAAKKRYVHRAHRKANILSKLKHELKSRYKNMGSGASISAGEMMSRAVDEAELSRALGPASWDRAVAAGVRTWMQDHQRASGSAPTWQHLKSAYPSLWIELLESRVIPASVTPQPQQQDPNVLPPIRLIDFDAFCREPELPRYPERKALCVTLDSIDRASSFIVFISHCWLRGWPGARDWNGRPHPDSKYHEKFKLCVAGIKKAWKVWAPDMPRCYVWLDFGCMDQDGNPAGELKQLDEIVRISDCLFTPVIGNATLAENFSNFYQDYQLHAWNAPQYGYTNRGWCRVEMFYASNIPYDADAQRLSKFRHALHSHASEHRRAHLLFTDREYNSELTPNVLPPLQNAFYDILDPSKGHVTMPADKQKIAELIEALRPYMRRVEEGYEGHLSNGKKHGYGVYRYADGSRYEGNWHQDKKQGQGTQKYLNGSIYEGDWFDGQRHGNGTLRGSDGSLYEGVWIQGRRQGKGTQLYADGSIYEGKWHMDCLHGPGTMKYLDGSVLQGAWESDRGIGRCTLRFANGNTLTGTYLDRYAIEGKFVFENNPTQYVAKFTLALGKGHKARPEYNVTLKDPSNNSLFREGRLVAGSFV